MDKKAMLKQAAQVLRDQQKEISELHEKVARAEKAEQIVRHLIENDELMAEDVLQKLSELRTKTYGDLELMEKAAEMFHSTFSASFGTLSNNSDFSSNPLLEYLFSE
jgi:DNA-directed RNA polymerase beta' subunit